MFETRAATRDDRPLIFATWLRAYRHGSHFPRKIPEAIFFDAHHDVVEELLDRAAVLVATPIGEPDVILGWSVVETLDPAPSDPASPIVVHFVYVKPPFRRSGVARALLATVEGIQEEGGTVFYSHETFALKADRLAEIVGSWTFNPYAALRRRVEK